MIDVFLNYCDENGIDDEMLDTEIMGEEDNSILVEFDDNFPFYKTPSNKDKFIASILQKCYLYPHARFLKEPDCNS